MVAGPVFDFVFVDELCLVEVVDCVRLVDGEVVDLVLSVIHFDADAVGCDKDDAVVGRVFDAAVVEAG